MMSTINNCRGTDTYTRQLAPNGSVPVDHAGMSLHTHFQPEITIVEVRGAVDAYNAERLSDRIDDLATRHRPLIVDLRGVDFFGSDGFRGLVKIAETCQREGVRWALVASRAVDRLLHTDDGDHGFPVAASLEEARQQLRPDSQAWSRKVLGMDKLTDRLKSILTQHVPSNVPDKQINRWEGEGGALYTPKPRGDSPAIVAALPMSLTLRT
ncbi:hypothetical protein A5791_15365 [Mycobacterium sp. 852002-51163_SCH5372311]|uniref:STAS domain-containing protein n=1 Tax=Mycobacterium sp. 852002-51163_SCH5372311 TaxID=1834097 RepID=UPI0008021A01|nr:STAS domain-containing protein [Mycobacterium sp. 852002-51163_SCH5372311]OBF91142.1 hypothetical protein A5791_15365 [Mycobacterium sp. 852002-51163_SCH5372311]